MSWKRAGTIRRRGQPPRSRLERLPERLEHRSVGTRVARRREALRDGRFANVAPDARLPARRPGRARQRTRPRSRGLNWNMLPSSSASREPRWLFSEQATESENGRYPSKPTLLLRTFYARSHPRSRGMQVPSRFGCTRASSRETVVWSRKPLPAVPSVEGSNPSPSAHLPARVPPGLVSGAARTASFPSRTTGFLDSIAGRSGNYLSMRPQLGKESR